MFPIFPSPNNCFYPVAHNSSYVDTPGNSDYVDGTNDLSYYYNDVFEEFTNEDMKIKCSNEQLCWIGCECKMTNGWSGGSTMSANGTLSTASAGGKLNSDYVIEGNNAAKKTTSSANPGISTMATGDNCTVSVTDPRYGLTCHKSSYYDCAGVCDGGAFYTCTSGSSSPSCSSSQYEYYVGVQKCTSGSSTNSTPCYTCKDCSWSCPDGYYTSASNGYFLKDNSGDDYEYQVCNGDSNKTNSTKCYKQAKCEFSCSAGYTLGLTESDCDSDETYTEGTVNKNDTSCSSSGIICGKCETSYYKLTVYTSASSNEGSITYMKSNVTVSGNGYSDEQSGEATTSDSFTFDNLPAGTYTVSGTASLKHKVGNAVASFCSSSISNKLSDSKTVTLPGTSSTTLSFNCNGTSGGGSCVDKPCQKLCCLTGSNKYLTTINGMTCCCPSASETDDKKCNCCL